MDFPPLNRLQPTIFPWFSKVIVVDDFFLSPLSYADPFRITGAPGVPGGELHTLEEVRG
jgi:hypothetical protein